MLEELLQPLCARVHDMKRLIDSLLVRRRVARHSLLVCFHLGAKCVRVCVRACVRVCVCLVLFIGRCSEEELLGR